MPDSYRECMALLQVLYERDYGIHTRAQERARAKQEAETLRKYQASVAALKRRDGQE